MSEIVRRQRGRKSAYAGKSIFLSKKTGGVNVRTPRTKGHASMEIVRIHPGITYEDFLAKGGRRQDIVHDEDKGNYDLR